jgi:phosphotransferase system enzyme I (PtsI)
VLLAEHLIQEVDFFSVGTNDLIQYTLAIDRNSEKAARYFEPLNPAVLYMLKKLADVANGAGKSITVCGEVAGDPMYLPILVGMGYRKLSVNPMAINMLKDIVRNISCGESRKIAAQAMEKKTAQDVRGFMREYLAGIRTQFSLAGESMASGLKSPAQE